MQEWSLSMNIIFIGLFVLIIVLYISFVLQTTWYLLKKRPTFLIKKWKSRFPLWEQFRLSPTTIKGAYPLAFLSILLLSWLWIQTGGQATYSFLFIFTCFAILIIMREFSVHYSLTEKALHVWSIHGSPYQTKNGELRHYRYLLEKKDIYRMEETKQGFHFYITNDAYVYVRASKEMRPLIKNWMNNTH